MDIASAQRDVRWTYLGGFVGQLVSAALWFASAGVATWGTVRAGILLLVFGGVLIFPVTTLILRLIGEKGSLGTGHPMNALGTQVALTLPLTLPLVGAAALYRIHWFYPAFMIALGAHYLPFVFLYGMRLFAALAAVLISTGLTLALWGPGWFSLGGWITGAVLILAAFLGKAAVDSERRAL